MRHRVGLRKLGRPTGHRLSLIRNLMTDLIRHEHLQTTEPKAAELRREVEKLIGTARAGDLVNLEFDLLAKYLERMIERPIVRSE